MVAFAIDMYAAVRRLEQQRIVNEEYLVKLSQERKKDTEFELGVKSGAGMHEILIGPR